MLYQTVIVFHVLFGLAVIGLVLMQQGKGADAGAAFGSGASGTIFGARGSASFLSRTTAISAALFFITSLGLAVLGGQQTTSTDIMEVPAPQSEVPVIGGSEIPAPPAVNEQQTAPSQPVAPVPAAPQAPSSNTAAPEAPATQPAEKPPEPKK